MGNPIALVVALTGRALRIRVAALLLNHETGEGVLCMLHKAFHTRMAHDLSVTALADSYAHKITYGLLTTVFCRKEFGNDQHGTALITDNVANFWSVTNPLLK